MHNTLARDYVAMTGMIFGKVPSFEAVIESVADLERQLNDVVKQVTTRQS